jgi:uncharacterized protein (UPF0147 family)
MAKTSPHLTEAIDALHNLESDESIPKNVRAKIQQIIKTLESNTEVSIKVNKTLHELDEIAEDINLQTFIRTQIWNVSSILEKV